MIEWDIVTWDCLDYIEAREPFIDVFPCGLVKDIETAELLSELLLQTQSEMDENSAPQDPDQIKFYTDKDSDNFLISKNRVLKLNKKVYLNTLGVYNEVRQIPCETNAFLFYNPNLVQ